jgi:hypothetical protein
MILIPVDDQHRRLDRPTKPGRQVHGRKLWSGFTLPVKWRYRLWDHESALPAFDGRLEFVGVFGNGLADGLYRASQQLVALAFSPVVRRPRRG